MSDVDYRVQLALEATDLRELVEDRLGPAKRGRFLCPFHDDQNPDFSVKDARFRCFACGESGNALDLLRKLDGTSFFEALEYLEQRAGIRPAIIGPETRKALDRVRDKARREKETVNERWRALCDLRERLLGEIKAKEHLMGAESVRFWVSKAYDVVQATEEEMAAFFEGGRA